MEELFHEKPTMMDMDTVVSPQTLAFTEHRYADIDHQKVANELRAFAATSMKLRDFGVAEEIFRNILHVESRCVKEDDTELITALANIGKCCELTGRLQEALSCYKEALQLRANRDLHLEPTSMQLLLASVLYDIGMIHSKVLVEDRNDRDTPNRKRDLATKATRAFSLVLKLRQTCLGENHPAVASAYHNIGVVLTANGIPSEAIAYHKKALTIRRIAFGHRHEEIASSLRHLAASHKDLGNFQNAAVCLTEALDILRCIPCEGFLCEVMIELSNVKRAFV